MSDLPSTWWADEIDGESRVLLGACLGLLHVVVPPGAGFGRSEPDDERTMWRWAIWTSEEDDPPAVCVDAPYSVSHLETREIVERLPRAHHDFVRRAMAQQIARAVTFGAPPRGRCPDECHARSAGRTLSWLANELSAAFPQEAWYRFDVESFEIPRTAAELLRRLPEPQSERLGRADVIASPAGDHRPVVVNHRHSILPRGGY